MPESKKTGAAEATPKPSAQVRIHNRYAGRPLVFRVPGQSVRLGPGESATLGAECLVAHELKTLCASGLVIVEHLPAAKARPRKRAASKKAKAGGAGPRTAKPKAASRRKKAAKRSDGDKSPPARRRKKGATSRKKGAAK